MSKTITALGMFGEKQLTREEFIERWVDVPRELRRLDYDPEWQNEVQNMIDTVTETAGREWDRLYAKQQSKTGPTIR